MSFLLWQRESGVAIASARFVLRDTLCATHRDPPLPAGGQALTQANTG